MGLTCAVCRHPDRLAIDIAIQEGVGTATIIERWGTSSQTVLNRASVDHHRKSGHAARALTAAVLGVANGPMAELVKIEVANKVWRVSKLQSFFDRLERIMEERSQVFSHLPGGSTGLVVSRPKMIGSGKDAREVEEQYFDRDLADSYRAALEQAAKECGEWRPSGDKDGEKDLQPITVNQTVVGGSQGAVVIERQVRDTSQPWQTRQYNQIDDSTPNSLLLNGLESRLAAVPAELLVEPSHDSMQSRDNDPSGSHVGGVEVIGAAQDDDDAES